MSINITVHGSPKKCSNKKRFLLDDEQAKRELLEERKKLRLKQVRQKSKEVAQKVRRNVDEAKRKQLRNIEATKAREMWLSRGEKMRQKCEEYRNTLEHLGESHIAAAEENYCCPCSEYSPASCRHTGDKWGDIRPTEPRPKEAQPGMSYNSFCRERAKKRLNKENHSPKADKSKCSPSNSAKRAPPASPCGKRKQSYSSDTSTRATLYSPYRRPSPKRRRGPKAKKKLVRTPSVILEIDSENDSSGLEVEDTLNDSNMKFTRVCSKSKHYPSAATVNVQPYNCSDYKGTDSSCAEQTPSCAEQTPSRAQQIPPVKVRFTQISDLIKRQDDKSRTCPQEQIRETSSRCVNEKEALPATTQTCSPPRSPPKPTPEPPQRISSLKTTSKISTKTDGNSQVTNRVQFFDYRNKFEKSYPRPNVVRTERDCSQPTAMQRAEEEKDVVKAYLEKLRKLSEKCESRSQRALEKERIRRDCQELTAKLEAISKGKPNCQLNSEDAYQFSEARLKHVSAERQSRMNDAVENVLKRPVLITCPEVERAPRSEAPQSFGRATPKDLNVFSQHRLTPTTGDNSDSVNTSDSCASILLNYVNSQSRKISDDISTCNNTEKVEKLKDLLQQINSLRKRLLEELEKAKGSENGPEIKEVVDGISTVSKERETILKEPDVEKEKYLEQREKKLKKREEMLEKKLKEFYEMTKAKTAESNSTSESVESEQVELSAQKLKTNIPLEITIKLKDSGSKTTKKSPYKIPRRRSSLINSPRKKKLNPKKELDFDLSRKLEKCHAELKKCQVDLEKCHHADMENRTTSESVENQMTPQSVENSSSTSYRSPPKKISPPLKAALEKREKEKVTSNKIDEICKPPPPSLKSLNRETAKIRLSKPPTTAANVTKDKRVENPCKAPQKKNLNPVLVHYIQRLLGMSRGSIDMLRVSSSEVDTPSSSIINVSTNANKSETESVLNQKDKIARLEKFIQDSYSFARELESSMRSMKSNSTDSSLKTIEEIWKRVLKQNQKSEQPSDRCKSPKPILKRDKRKKAPQTSTAVSPRKSKKSEDADKVNLAKKYTELNESCAQRIAELSKMINKVRQEKQRILDITLSSASPSGRSTTEYVDFAERGTRKPGTPQQNVQVEQECDKGRLEKNKLTGVSRDSGISTTSRPATALDFRESPALQFCAQGNVVFEPILKDIPKPSKSGNSPAKPVPHHGGIEGSKKGKPPAAMARYSPQLDELPHELSTIIEVDTAPLTSVSNVEKQLKQPLVDLQKEMELIHPYSKFPTFEEYIKKNKIDLTMLDPDVSSKLQEELQELLNVANVVKKIKYREFSSKCSSSEDEDNDLQKSIENLIKSLKMLTIGIKSFPTHDEYIEQLKRTDIMQPDKSSDNGEEKSKSEVISIESLPDIVGELIRRKMLKHSFQNVSDASIKKEDGKRSKKSKNFGSDTSKSKPEKDLMGSSSPRKKTPSRKDVEEELLSGLEMLHFSNQSNSDNIEKELEGMGLKWAALMLRKSQNIQDVNSSTSSSILFTSRRKSGKKKSAQKEIVEDAKESRNATQQESLEGRPLNLKDFLAKELQKRTQLSTSSSSQDDSLASQLLRSMFGSDSSEKRKITSISEQHTNRILTSTPVPAGSTSSSKPITNHSTQKFFAAESLSTVRFSHSDSDGPSNSAEKRNRPGVWVESPTKFKSSSC